MNAMLPSQARIVIIGGGIVGCSTAYHLAKLGCTDVILLEQNRLTSGSTWHAAGAVGQLRANANITRLLGHSVAVYSRLEAETGLATGWYANGSLRLACTRERRAEFERATTTAHSFGLEMHMISPAEATKLFPVMKPDDLICAAFVPSDGVANPSDITMALAKGARQAGARLFEHVRVTAIEMTAGRPRAVVTDQGRIACEIVVCCAGIWSRSVGRMAGVTIPLQPSHHQYFVTEKIEGLSKDTPTIRDPDHLTYFKEEVGGLAVGGYERQPIAYGEYPISEHHEFRLMPENTDHFQPLLEAATHRVPALERVGVKKWFNGIESFTEDGMFILGEAPECRNFFVGCGFNAFGIASAGGAGKALAEWILAGEQPFDLWPVDIRRFSRYHRSDRQVMVRALEGQGHHYTMGWPGEEMIAGRPLRRSAIYDRLKAAGAVFGNKSGWERPNWFSFDGETEENYTFDTPNWHGAVARESQAVRTAAGLFDQSSFAKFLVVGADAGTALSALCAGQVLKPAGHVTYTQMLNRNGGIECDVTVSRLADDRFYVITGTGFATHDFAHIQHSLDPALRASVVDVTSAYGTLALMGPASRAILSKLAEADLSNHGFPFGQAREIMIAGAPVLALRMTFVGELGWELHVPSEYMQTVYDALKEAGRDAGLLDAGYRTIDALRLEKGYRVWAADIGPDYTPLEAGLGFAVDLKEGRNFIGRDALLRQRAEGIRKMLVTFTVDEPGVVLHGRETILRDGKRVGWTTSAGYGHSVGKAIALGYVRAEHPVDKAFIESGRYQLEVRTRLVDARAHLQPLYDPGNARIKA